ncbi:MAG: bifunctional adenosylcobinamide kinase/adenosylcobinamide-phosphate guanylyltransferase [Acidobacteria bacterium]|nr:bifunctional adenosylcobinamide kinase/adenosylcobinamide-phosphate guanylyltransferase [Acidobacteriota bacterium]
METPRPRRVTLVLGGVRSGKSRYAQRLAEAATGRVAFVATATAFDDEMRVKIQRHRATRPAAWLTVEEPLELAAVLAQTECELVLIDCLTIYAANLLHATGEDEGAARQRMTELCAAIENARCDVVLVSNEVGSGVVPAYALGRQFRDALGELNQMVAAVADDVVLLVAGLPLALKGSIRRLA